MAGPLVAAGAPRLHDHDARSRSHAPVALAASATTRQAAFDLAGGMPADGRERSEAPWRPGALRNGRGGGRCGIARCWSVISRARSRRSTRFTHRTLPTVRRLSRRPTRDRVRAARPRQESFLQRIDRGHLRPGLSGAALAARHRRGRLAEDQRTRWRRLSREVQASTRSPNRRFFPKWIASPIATRWRRALAAINPDRREALMLHHVYGLSFRRGRRHRRRQRDCGAGARLPRHGRFEGSAQRGRTAMTDARPPVDLRAEIRPDERP